MGPPSRNSTTDPLEILSPLEAEALLALASISGKILGALMGVKSLLEWQR